MKVWIQEWEESERGYGIRFEGYTVHDSEHDLKKFIQSHWNSMPNEVPDCYIRPDGKPFQREAPNDVRESMLVATIKGEPLWVYELNCKWIRTEIKE